MNQPLENRLSGSPLSRFWQELFRNSGQYPIAILLIEFLIEKWDYLRRPDAYVLIPAAALQAYWLSRQREFSAWRSFFGNLIAPALYSFGEMALEGFEFFDKPHHVVYWVFAFLVGLLQALQRGKFHAFFNLFLVLEDLVRSQILFVAYAVFESYTNPAQTVTLGGFFSDPSHIMIGLATLILGLSAGAADVTARNYLTMLRETAERLKVYSEWLLGRDLLGRALNDPNSMTLSFQTRAILFMDIRGFTAWSEKRQPQEVASLLNEYYLAVEKVLERFQVVKYKFTADEVMAVFIESEEALRAANEIRLQANRCLQTYGLGAGLGVHAGAVVEGLLGAQNVRFYDVIGDVVNTASRIEQSAAAGELWVSESVLAQVPNWPTLTQKEIEAKGKEAPLKVYLIE